MFDADAMRRAVAAQELLRGRVPDEVIDAALTAINAQLADRSTEEPSPPSIRLLVGAAVPTIGRDQEMARLQQTYTDVIAYSVVRVVNLVGDAGCGKTRLIDDLHRWIDTQPHGALLLRSRAAPEGRAMPLGGVRTLIARQLGIRDDDTTGEVATKLSDGLASLESAHAEVVGHWVGFDLANRPAVRHVADNPEFGAIALGHLTAHLRTILATQPMVLLVEDLQWSDDESLDVIGHLVDELADLPLLVVCATRPSLFEQRPSWTAGPRDATTDIDVGPLDADARREHANELLRLVDGDISRPVELIAHHAAGNPLHAEELVALLVDTDVLTMIERSWQLDPDRLERLDVPSEIADVIETRLGLLPEDELAIVHRAAVIGRRFWDDAIVAAAATSNHGPRTHTEVASALWKLWERGYVDQQRWSAYTGCREYAFRHPAIREAADEQPADDRVATHAAVANWLERRTPDRLGEFSSAVAEHLARAGEFERAADLLHEAGARASASGARQSAVRFYERSLNCRNLTGTGDGLPATSTRIEAAHLLVPLGRNDEAAAFYRQAETDAMRSGSHRLAANAIAGALRTAAARSDWSEAPDLIERVRPLAERFGGDILGRFLSGHALWLIDGPEQDLGEAQHDLERALEIWRGLDDASAEIRSLNELGLLNSKADRPEEADRWYEEGLAVARRVGDTNGEWMLLQNQAVLAHLQARTGRSDYSRVLGLYRASLDQRRRLGLPSSINLANLAQAEVEAGQIESGRRHAVDALRVGWERHDPIDWTIALIALAQIAFVEQRTDEGADILRCVLAARRTPSVEREIGAVLEYHDINEAIATSIDAPPERSLTETVEQLLGTST